MPLQKVGLFPYTLTPPTTSRHLGGSREGESCRIWCPATFCTFHSVIHHDWWTATFQWATHFEHGSMQFCGRTQAAAFGQTRPKATRASPAAKLSIDKFLNLIHAGFLIIMYPSTREQCSSYQCLLLDWCILASSAYHFNTLIPSQLGGGIGLRSWGNQGLCK